MPKKPETIQELEKDLREHPERGRINGVEICDISNSQLNCEINGTTYNRLILLRGAIGFTKSQIASSAMKEFLSVLIQNKSNKISINDVAVGGTSLFRGQVPVWIYGRCTAIGKELGLSVRQVCTAALTRYANNPESLFLIQEFLQSKALELDCSQDDVKEAMYGFSKRVAREERLKRLKVGEKVERKMDI